MEKFYTVCNFDKNDISYEANISGEIYEKSDENIKSLHETDLIYAFKYRISNAIMYALSIDGLFLNNDPIMSIDTKIMQSQNGEYFILIDEELYPFSMNIKIKVLSDPFKLIIK